METENIREEIDKVVWISGAGCPIHNTCIDFNSTCEYSYKYCGRYEIERDKLLREVFEE